MTDQNNTADTYGGGAHKRVPGFAMPAQVRPVPTYTDPGDPDVISDSNKIVETLKSDLGRHVASTNRPGTVTPMATTTTPLKEIAQRIKKLIHDDGEQFGDELAAKFGAKTRVEETQISMAKALQKWADDTLSEKESQRGA